MNITDNGNNYSFFFLLALKYLSTLIRFKGRVKKTFHKNAVTDSLGDFLPVIKLHLQI